MDDFAEDTNPFETNVDDVFDVDVNNAVVDPPVPADVLPPSPSPPPLEDLVSTPTEPPAVPSKSIFPETRPYNQLNGYRSPIDLYLHSGDDVEIHVRSDMIWTLLVVYLILAFRLRRPSKLQNIQIRHILPMS